MYVYHVHLVYSCLQRLEERVRSPGELDLQIVVSCCVGNRDRTLLL